ncbi:peptidase family C78 domain-containing protein [Trichoderma compactum]
MAITEPDEISITPRNAHLEGQRTGSVSRTSRPFPASLIPGQPNRIVISQSWKRLLPRRRLRAQPTAGVRSKTKESLDASARSPNGRAGTQSASRLGTLQLGKYAHEEEMPLWLVKLLETKGDLRAGGVIPALKQLLDLSSRTESEQLIHGHIGAFCGYRNIQVLSSHIIGTRATGWEQLGDDIPGIFQVQDMIETAWDRGYNARGRVETGGIRGTRKYIGTPEAQAFFASMGFPCSVQAFKASSEDDNASRRLLGAIERYFQQGAVGSMDNKVRSTLLPPIYLQRPKHSLTIVGLEKHKGGDVQLLVFDPEFQSSSTVVRLAGKATLRRQSKVTKLLEPYRRSATHLERFNEFEVLYSLENLIKTFNELNATTVDELFSEPSPLEFMRYVARNTPFVIRGGASSWKATKKWNAAYLKTALEGQFVNVAVTPFGNADAPTFSSEHQATVIAKPHEETQQFGDFFAYITQQETDPGFPLDSEVRYAQTREIQTLLSLFYLPLYPDALKDIPFARIALGKEPDAINLWIGNSRSTTCLHKDNFENIFVQIVGRKHFVLLPPLLHACVNEDLLLPATYVREGQGFALRLDPDSPPVPLATWDPDDPGQNASPLSALAKPLHVTLDPGDMLYLPAMWYDMDFSGPLYPVTSFLRELGTKKQSMLPSDESSHRIQPPTAE